MRPSASLHQAAGNLLELLPQSRSAHSKHTPFSDLFRSSRLASVQQLRPQIPSFFTRHQQHYPTHQVISSFNAAHRRGEWGLKRPLPRVKDAHIVVSDIDSQERQTPFTFATEKPRFIRRMKELCLALQVPSIDNTLANHMPYRLPERQSRRPRSPLEHLHPQWNRKSGNERGPQLLTLSHNSFKNFLRTAAGKREDLDVIRVRLGITDNQKEATKELIQACLDLPMHKPVYQTHPTAGLAYSVKGWMPSTPNGTQSDARTRVGGTRPGRLLRPQARKRDVFGPSSALVHGVVARVESGWKSVPDRRTPVELQVESAAISPFGRLELTVTTFKPSPPTSKR